MASLEKVTNPAAETDELYAWLRESGGDNVRHLGSTNGVVRLEDVDVEADLQKLGVPYQRIGPLHPLAEGLRRQVHNLQTFFQRRRFPSAAA